MTIPGCMEHENVAQYRDLWVKMAILAGRQVQKCIYLTRELQWGTGRPDTMVEGVHEWDGYPTGTPLWRRYERERVGCPVGLCTIECTFHYYGLLTLITCLY